MLRTLAESKVEGVPTMSKHSLMVTGTPASGPSVSPRARLASTSRASVRAASKKRSTTAWIFGSTSSTRAMMASTTSAAENWPSAMPRAISTARSDVMRAPVPASGAEGLSIARTPG
jgi:hypothetical protein